MVHLLLVTNVILVKDLYYGNYISRKEGFSFFKNLDFSLEHLERKSGTVI